MLHGRRMLGPKERELLKFLSEGPKLMQEIYEHFQADTEGKKANVRKLVSKLRNKGLIGKLPKAPYYVLTPKGKKILECIRLLEE